MFTKWDEVESWIRDNGFPRWIFYRNNPQERDEKANDKIIDSNNFTVSDIEDKIAMTKKYLQMAGGRAWGVGFSKPLAVQDGIVCEVRLESEVPASGIGMPMQQQNIGEIAEQLRKSISSEMEAKWKQREAERERKDFEEKKRIFEEKEQSVWGLIVNKLAPVAVAAAQGKGLANSLRQVAGVDAEEDVHAAEIIPHAPSAEPEQPSQEPEQEPQEENPFTDAEADQLFTLLAEWKKADPDYLVLLGKVVEMAKSGDKNYLLAKTMLG